MVNKEVVLSHVMLGNNANVVGSSKVMSFFLFFGW